MAFVIEQITAENQEKILHDMQNDPDKLRNLNYAIQDDTFPTRWTIDHESDYYLLKAPIMVREERLGHLYYMYFQYEFYEVETKSIFENIIFLNQKPDTNLLVGLQKAVKEAFEVYGHLGLGTPSDAISDAEVITTLKE